MGFLNCFILSVYNLININDMHILSLFSFMCFHDFTADTNDNNLHVVTTLMRNSDVQKCNAIILL